MSLPDIQIKKTTDGSNTLYLPELDETYHSLNGALSESFHVYIQNGLLKQLPIAGDTIRILEIGFGTAMNALLCLDHLPSSVQCAYYSLEPYPLSVDLIKTYYSDFKTLPTSFDKLDTLVAKQNQWQSIQDNFKVFVDTTKLQDIAMDTILENTSNHYFDLVFYDAFAPSRQPELWVPSSLEKVKNLMKSRALLTTYCAQGQFKRDLKSLGFVVEHPAGPNGKREMTNAFK